MKNFELYFQNIVKESFKNKISEKSTNLIAQIIKKIPLYYPHELTESDFMKTANGKETLNTDVIPNDELFLNLIATGNPLESLTKVNAFYSVEAFLGKKQYSKEAIHLLPAYYDFYNVSIYSIISVLAHEIAHAFDPNKLVIQGLHIAGGYDDLIKCMKDAYKINFNQRGEAFADWIRTESIAKIIKSLSKEKAKEAAVKASMSFCLYEKQLIDPSNPYLSGKEHPESVLRVNAILLSHPSITEALGCQNDGPYPHCPSEGKK